MKIIITILLICSITFTSLKADISQWFKKGLKSYQIGNYDDAILNIRKVIENDPENSQAYYYIGMSYLMTQQFEDAIDNFTQSIKINPQNPDAFNNRGIANGYVGNPELAFNDFDRAILLDPGFAEAYLNRGTAFIEKNEMKNAIKDLKNAIKYDNKNPSAYFHLGRIHIRNGEREKAISEFKNAIKNGMNSPEVYFQLGNIYFSMKKIKIAIQEYTKAIKINPSFDKALNNRALAYEKLGNKSLASKDREKINKITGVNFLEHDKIKYLKVNTDDKKISIEVPNHWSIQSLSDSNAVELYITPYNIESHKTVLTSVSITKQENMYQRYGFKETGAILEFWKASNEINFEDYEVNTNIKIKSLSKNGYDIRIFHNEIQKDPGSMKFRHISWVAASNDVLIYAYFICPEIQILYFEPIFEKIIASIKF